MRPGRCEGEDQGEEGPYLNGVTTSPWPVLKQPWLKKKKNKKKSTQITDTKKD